MRGLFISACAVLSVSAVLLSGSLAVSSPAASGSAKLPAPDVLSEEDRNAAPIPPGKHAALVKRVCMGCHGADLVTGMRYTQEEAERFYKNMVSPDVTTDQAKQIIEYLTTYLGA